MRLKIRKLLTVTASLACLLFLSACLEDMDAPPPVTVAQIATPAVAPAPAPAPELPLLYCRIGHGSALFGHDWYDFDETLFSLHRGDHVNIKIPRVRSMQEMTVQAYFDSSGQKLIFCPFMQGAPDQRISCASLYALDEDLQEGIKRTFDIPEAIRGGAITCAYSQGKLRSLEMPAAGGN